MYPHTIAGLFDAVAKGTLADVDEIIKSQKVDINQHYNDTHIIEHAFCNHYLQSDEKISSLINSGAILNFNRNFNILGPLQLMENKELQNQILNLIKNNAQFANIYTQHHYAAMNGIPPQTQEEAFKTDYFGLYPIHYALSYKKADKSWFETIKYDLFTPVKGGLYEGTNLFYFIVATNYISDDLISLITNLSPNEIYNTLKSGPVNRNHHHYGYTLASWLLAHKRYEDFSRLTQALSAEQRFELLKSGPINPNHNDYGATLATVLLAKKRYEDFSRLTQGLSAGQRFELLKSGPLNPNKNGYGYTLAIGLLEEKRYEDFSRLTQGLSVEQRFELLKSAPLNPNCVIYGSAIAIWLFVLKRHEDFSRLTQGLSAEQRFEILKHAVLKDNDIDYGITVACYLLMNKRYEDLTRLTQGLSADQRFVLLNSSPLNRKHPSYNKKMVWSLLKHERFDDFSRLTQGLSPDQRFELLNSEPVDADNCLSVNVAWMLLKYKRNDDFTRLTQGLSAKQRLALLESTVTEEYNSQTIVGMLLEIEGNEYFIRLTQDFTAEQRFELLKVGTFNYYPEDKCLYYDEDDDRIIIDQLIDQRRFALLEKLLKDMSLDQLFELLSVEHDAIEMPVLMGDVYFTRLDTLFIKDEHTLIKIFEPFESNDIIEKFYNKLKHDSEGMYVISYIIFIKMSITLRQQLQIKSEQKEKIAIFINDNLENLLNIYEQIKNHPKIDKKASELLGRTICEACFTEYRQQFVDFYESEKASNSKCCESYKFIKARDPQNALEGFGYHLRILGCEDSDQSHQLGVEFAESISNKNKLKFNNKEESSKTVIVPTIEMPPAPSITNDDKDTQSLKRRVAELEEENRKLREKSRSIEKEESNSDEEPNPKKSKSGNYTIETNISPINKSSVSTLFNQRTVPSMDLTTRSKIDQMTRSSQRRAPK